MIFGAVMEAAMVDTIEGHESTILDWVAKEWKLEGQSSRSHPRTEAGLGADTRGRCSASHAR